MQSSNAPQKKMTSSSFADYFMNMADLYNLAMRNGYYLPSQKSSAVNELMLFHVLQGQYWCPKYADIKLKPCVRAPVKEVLIKKVMALAESNNLNVAWIDSVHHPDKDWLVAVIATLNPGDEIFNKDYVAPPIRKRLQDVETISLPNELFEGLPKSTRKVKARRLKIMSEAFAEEKATRMKEMRKALDNEILEQEVRLEDIRQRKKARTMDEIGQRDREEVKVPKVS